MAHAIEIRNGEASMMYVGEVPWHGLGTRLEGPATAEEAIRAAKLDWTVAKRPLYAWGRNTVLRVPDRFAIVREDLADEDLPVLGVVGPGYVPLQNREAFGFFDAIVGEGAAIYHTAGVLGKGERIWVLAKLPSTIRVVGDDVADKYLLLANSHDGSTCVQVRFTPVRVVCQNTLTMALTTGETRIARVFHTRRLKRDLAKAREALGIIEDGFGRLGKTFQAMARVPMNEERLDEYLEAVFPWPPDHPNPRIELNRLKPVFKGRIWSKHFFEEGRGTELPGVRGTLWAAYNGVTEYVDHLFLPGRPERRLRSVWFGKGQRTKARAYRMAVERMKIWRN